MKKIIYNSIIACSVGVTLFLTSCSSSLYAPSSANVPLHTKKGEFLVEAKGGTDNYALQGSFSVTDHINIFANGSYFNTKNTETSPSTEFNMKTLVEGGLGYFGKIGEEGLFEVQAGYGKGFSKNFLTEKGKDAKYFESSTFYSADYNKFFIQPSLGVIAGKNETFAVGAKVSQVNFTRFATIDNSADKKDKKSTFIEPHLQYRGTWNNFSLVLQTGLSFSLSKSDELAFKIFPVQASAGLGYRLNFNK